MKCTCNPRAMQMHRFFMQMESGEPLFCLADVCKALGLTNPRKVKTSLNQRV